MSKTSREKTGDGPITIKKYANRRLYDTSSSKYITLDHLANLIRKDIEFVVIDAKSGGDITHNVLTQIIMDEESSGQGLLPTNFLKEIISFYGGSMQNMIPDYLDNSMRAFRENQRQMDDALESAVAQGPFGEIARKNLQMMKAARDAFVPAKPGSGASPADRNRSEADPNRGEMDELKRQVAELQAKLDRMSPEN